MQKSLVEGLAAIAHPEARSFYNCTRCGWSGKELVHADENGKGAALTAGANHRPYRPYQEHCPRCGQPFEGCFAGPVLSAASGA